MKINPLVAKPEGPEASPAAPPEVAVRGERASTQAAIDERVDVLAHEAVARFAALSSRPYFRSAIMKAALDEMCERFAALDGVSSEELSAHLMALSRRVGRREGEREAPPGDQASNARAPYFGGTPLRN